MKSKAPEYVKGFRWICFFYRQLRRYFHYFIFLFVVIIPKLTITITIAIVIVAAAAAPSMWKIYIPKDEQFIFNGRKKIIIRHPSCIVWNNYQSLLFTASSLGCSELDPNYISSWHLSLRKIMNICLMFLYQIILVVFSLTEVKLQPCGLGRI